MAPSHFEWEPEFFFHCPQAPKWLLQFSSNIPQGFAIPEVFISAPQNVTTDSGRDEVAGQNGNHLGNPTCLSFT